MKTMQAEPVKSFSCDDAFLVATYDPAGAVIRLFDRTVDDQTLTFSKSEGLIMEDDATGSQWELMTGQCVSGELKGKALTPMPGIMSFRKAWKKFHPDSQDVE